MKKTALAFAALLLTAFAASAAVAPDLVEYAQKLEQFPATKGQGSESERLQKLFDLTWEYLMHSSPELATQVGQANALQTGLSYFSSALSSELERALIQDFGVPIDLIEIRPGVTTRTGVAAPTQLAAGWQIGRKTFLTFNAGFCPDFSQLSYRNIGASLEFRFSREWRLQGSVEPTYQSCSGTSFVNPFLSSNRYQIGTDILWEREF